MLPFFRKAKLDQCTDEQLIQEIGFGHEAAFNLLYQRYADKMFRFFLKLLYNDQNKAEDFLQELFLKVINNADSFDHRYKASTWLYSIATNMCKNEWRNSALRREKLKTFDAWEHHSLSVEERVQQKQIALIIEEHLKMLDESDQMMVHLRFQQELSIKEIASVMQIPDGTVKSRIFYLLKKIAKHIDNKPIK